MMFQFRNPSTHGKVHIRVSAVEGVTVEGVIEESHGGDWFLTLHMASGQKVQVYVNKEERQAFFKLLGVAE